MATLQIRVDDTLKNSRHSISKSRTRYFNGNTHFFKCSYRKFRDSFYSAA